MKKSDGSTRIFGVLFHEEDVLAYFVFLEGLGLLLLVFFLKLVYFKEKDEA